MNPLLSIAWRNVFRNARRSLFTLLAIIVGVAVVVMLKGFADGFVRMSIENVVNSKVGAFQIHKKGLQDDLNANPASYHFGYDPELVAKIRAVPGVTAVTGRISFSGFLGNGKNQALVFGRGIEPDQELTVCPRANESLSPGSSPLSKDHRDRALLGGELAASLGLASMDPAAPVSFFVSSSSPRGRQNGIYAEVQGLTHSAFAIEEKRVITVPLAFAQSLLDLSGQVTELAASVDNLDNLDAIVDAARIAAGPQYEVYGWKELQPFLRDIIARQKIMIGIVSAVLFILALFVITNTMVMSVFERVREIGTMMSIGVKRGQIRLIFLGEALFLGCVGGLIGALLAVLVILLINIQGLTFPSGTAGAVNHLYPQLSAWFLLGAFLAGAVCAGLAGLYPALKASKLDPVEALRSN